jgi:alanine racemase
VDLSAFVRNLKALADLAGPGARLMPVLKADGYGHGAVPLARAAEGAGVRSLWGFGVSSVEEGISLRRAGARKPILILGSLYPFDSFRAVLAHRLTPTVASLSAVHALARAAGRSRRAPVHLKVDTGMGRIGVSPAAAPAAARAVRARGTLRLEGVYTHLARADSFPATRAQLDVFRRVVRSLRRSGPLLAHAANSAGLLHHPASRMELVRPGLALFGASSWPGRRDPVELAPVLTWKSRVVFIKTVPPGTPVSYGAAFRTRRRSRLATLPVGYADGYRRALTGRAAALLRGRRCPVVGRVTMDQIVVDATGVPGVDVGEEAVLLGAQGEARISVEEMAAWADTIPYEIFCGISSRVPRVLSPGL